MRLGPAVFGAERWLRLRYARTGRRAVGAAEGGRVSEAPRLALRSVLWRLLRDCESVLDIGTGQMRSLAEAPCRTRIGLEAHRPYLEHRIVRDAVPVNASALEIERLFVGDAVDAVTLMDVVEHFAPEEAREVLRQAELVARRRVLLFTPRGEFPQEDYDPIGLGGEELQRHRSSWEPVDFTARGYRVVVMRGYHGPWNRAFVEGFGADAPPVDALVAWKEV